MDELFVILLVIGIFASFIGTLTGGGGLITLPAMMLVGIPIQVGIATNKFSASIAALTSVSYLLRSKRGLTKFRNKYVSIVFQSYNLLPYMTALQNVVTAMEITDSTHKNKADFALQMLEKMGITRKQSMQKVLTLSGGQQQRVSIARALCCESPLIAADEPTGNLDEDTAEEIVHILKDLAHKEGKCVIVVTHDQNIAATSDTTIKLSKGEITVIQN